MRKLGLEIELWGLSTSLVATALHEAACVLPSFGVFKTALEPPADVPCLLSTSPSSLYPQRVVLSVSGHATSGCRTRWTRDCELQPCSQQSRAEHSNLRCLSVDARDDESKALRKQRKRDKKRAREAAERSAAVASTAPAPDSMDDDAAAAKQKRKQAKKQKKAEDGAQASAAAQGAEEDGDKVERKRRRKEEKRKAAAGAAEGDTAAAAPSDGKPGKKQKGGKGKQGHASAAFAAVGDVELAKRSEPIRKALYTEHADVAGMAADAVAAFQKERDISVEGSDTKPVTAFEHLGFDADLLHAVKDFKVPSPVQAQCWPLVLQGHDLIGIAATGSGAPPTHL